MPRKTNGIQSGQACGYPALGKPLICRDRKIVTRCIRPVTGHCCYEGTDFRDIGKRSLNIVEWVGKLGISIDPELSDLF
jgi:hypothetical protein